MPWLGKNDRPAKAATRARLLWDRTYLYFSADMDDADLFADVTEHDGKIWNTDCFELFFKPAKDKSGYYEFEVNAANAVLDMFIPARDPRAYDRFNNDGDFDIKTAVKLRGTLNHSDDKDKGWTVEGRIAWKSLLRTGGRPEAGETWTFALCRVDVTGSVENQELSTAASLGGAAPNFHRTEDYAPLKFIGPDQAAGVDALPPLTTSRVIGSPAPPDPYFAVNAYPNLKLRYPIALDHQPGSDQMLAVLEDRPYGPTSIVRFTDNPAVDHIEKLLDLDAVAYDFAFHPDFAHNGYVYIGMNGPCSTKPTKTKVVRYHIDPAAPYAFDPASALTILEWDSDGHNGGAVDFGPDGMLYVTSGDGTSDSDLNHAGQDLSKLLSKVLRIDVDNPAPGLLYSVPPTNPYVGREKENIRPETWAWGLRNPWRMAFDSESGRLWVTQNGQDQWEQVYLIEKGANYGWSATEGSHPFYPDRKRGSDPIRPPTAEYPHAEARSLTGGIVYHGPRLPELNGAYLYGDYSTGKVWGIRHDGKQILWNRELADTHRHITGFGTNARGELLLLDHAPAGGIYRLERTPPAVATTPFPSKLSESGLFKSVADHVMQDGILPYSVNSELWSDGAYKTRYLALPHRDDADRRVGFTPWRGFDFPDETVLVKSFALETQTGDPKSRKWVETRFFTKQHGEWAGYSYAWNTEGTDATLVEAAGMDKPFEIHDAAGGVRKQSWHYPSRTECMVCHSRAFNFVLGLSELQLNKDHDYGGGRTANQLRTWEHLGLFKVGWKDEAVSDVRADGKARGLQDKALDDYLRQQTESPDQREAKPSSLLAKAPDAYPRLANPHDATASLDARARSYLHSNCAICHVEAGGGNSPMDLEFTTEASKMRVFDVPPLHETMGLPDARVIAVAAPERSVLLRRISIRGASQMPPLATSVVDEHAVKLIHDWIAQQAPADPK